MIAETAVSAEVASSAAAAAGMPAIALTDELNLFAMVKFYREALKKGIKPLTGVDRRHPQWRTRAPGRKARAAARWLLRPPQASWFVVMDAWCACQWSLSRPWHRAPRSVR